VFPGGGKFITHTFVHDDANLGFNINVKASGLSLAFTKAAAEYSRTEETKKYAIFRLGLRFSSTQGRINHLVEIGHGKPLRLVLGTNAKKGATSWK